MKCNLFGGFLADQYILYDFKHNSKSQFLSEFDWYKSRYINAPFDFAFNNKVICSEILKQHIKVAEILFLKNRGILYDFKNGTKQNNDVFECLRERGKIIYKPFAMGKGDNVHLFSYINEKIYIDNKLSEKDQLFNFLDKSDEYIICEFVKQHKYADELFDKTANTIRLITIRDMQTHRMKIFFAVQRMGRNSTIPVDNGSRGGLIAKINLETGILSEAKCLRSTETFSVHPDSGNKIKGIQIPDWQQIKSEILRVADQLPFMDFIAWDLLKTSDGICVIEANSSSGVNIIQLWGGQRQGELGDFYRHYNVIK